MRTHNHLEIKELCEKSIGALMKKHDLGDVIHIEIDKEGWVNPCFFVNTSYVFRFNARDPILPKYHREHFSFNKLKESTIPVPRLVILDESKDCCLYDVLITEMLPGTNLESIWNDLNIEERSHIAGEAGKILNQLNQYEFDFFGELSTQGPFPRTNEWKEYLKAKLEFHLNEALDLDLFNSKIIEKIWHNFNGHQQILSEIKSGKLVHVDYHFGNLLYKESKITGVLDFEWAFSGDPLYDFCRWREGNEDLPDSRESFLKGYNKNKFSEDELRRMDIYQMIRNVELCIVARLHFNKAEAEEYLQTTIRQIDLISDNF